MIRLGRRTALRIWNPSLSQIQQEGDAPLKVEAANAISFFSTENPSSSELPSCGQNAWNSIYQISISNRKTAKALSLSSEEALSSKFGERIRGSLWIRKEYLFLALEAWSFLLSGNVLLSLSPRAVFFFQLVKGLRLRPSYRSIEGLFLSLYDDWKSHLRRESHERSAFLLISWSFPAWILPVLKA